MKGRLTNRIHRIQLNHEGSTFTSERARRRKKLSRYFVSTCVEKGNANEERRREGRRGGRKGDRSHRNARGVERVDMEGALGCWRK